MRPAFAALYAGALGFPSLPATDATLTIRPYYRGRLVKLALQNAMSTPQELKAQIEREIPQWQEVARAAGIKQQD
jgi:hypothetical protein